MTEDYAQVVAERDELGRAAFEAYVVAGHDTDGARTWQEFFRPMPLHTWTTVVGGAISETIRDLESDS